MPACLTCPACAGTGLFVVNACPYEALTPEVHEFLAYFDCAENGAWPRGSGVHNETVAFFEAWRWMRAEEAEWRARQAEEREAFYRRIIGLH